jgi:hypothetical protein
MAPKRKINDEHRIFKEDWTELFFFIEHGGKLLCLICNKTITVMKEYNVRRHYDNEHKAKFENLTGELRQNKIKHFLTSLGSQQNIFKSQNTRNEASVRASYVVAEMLAKNNRPFTDIEFFKKCMLAVTNEVCPEKIKLFEEISLSTRTCVRRTEELGNNLFSQLKDIIPSLDCFSIAIDESTDISDTAQLLIFIRGIDKEFNIYEVSRYV